MPDILKINFKCKKRTACIIVIKIVIIASRNRQSISEARGEKLITTLPNSPSGYRIYWHLRSTVLVCDQLKLMHANCQLIDR